VVAEDTDPEGRCAGVEVEAGTGLAATGGAWAFTAGDWATAFFAMLQGYRGLLSGRRGGRGRRLAMR
jgi:hypothetical protein